MDAARCLRVARRVVCAGREDPYWLGFTVKKIFAVAALSVAGVAAAVAPAAAADVHNDAPHSTAPVGALINGDVVNVNGDVLSDLCVAPWHWDGPIQVLTDNAPYQACQETGGVQEDAPQVDLHHDVPFLGAL